MAQHDGSNVATADVPLMVKDVNNDVEAQYNPTFTPTHSNKDPGEVVIVQPPKFIGLSKEELEKYRDDPFWKRLRWILFIIFCVSWVAMFVAAIIIVIQSPSCPAKFKAEWWQTKLNYQIWTPLFKDSDGDGKGDLAGVQSKLSDLSRIGIQAIWPTPLLEGNDLDPGYSVFNHTKVDPSIGGNAALYSLIKAAHSYDMYVVIDFPLTTTSTDHEWFKTDPTNHYVTSDTPGDANYWSTTKVGGVDINYLHVLDKENIPVLDWTKDSVKEYMKTSIHEWMDSGVNGFYLGHIDYLARSTDYSKPEWEAIKVNIELVAEWVNEHKDGSQIVLFSSVDDPTADEHLVTEAGLDYVINQQLSAVKSDNPSELAAQVYNAIEPVIEAHSNANDSWPYWELGNPNVGRVCSRTPKESCELMHILLLSLPGAVNVYYGDELGMSDLDPQSINSSPNKDDWMRFPQRSPMQWNSANQWAGFSDADQSKLENVPPANPNYENTNFQTETGAWRSMLKTFKKFADVRLRRESFYGGDMSIRVEGPLITYSRHPGGRAGQLTFFGALNFANETVPVSFESMNATGTGEVVAVSSNIRGFTPRDKGIQLSGEGFSLGPYMGLLLKTTE